MSNKNLTNNQLLLREIISQGYEDDSQFASLDTFFELFSAGQILKDYAFSNEEIESGLTGGGNDGGCDTVYVLLDNEIITFDQIESLDCSKGSSLQFIITQSRNTLGSGEDAIMKWKTISDNLLEMSNDINQHKERYSEEIRNVFVLFCSAMTKLITK